MAVRIGPTDFISQNIYYISTITLPNGNVLIAFRNSGMSGVGTFAILGKKCLQLQKVNRNEVRLWNYTGEELELMLSVDQGPVSAEPI